MHSRGAVAAAVLLLCSCLPVVARAAEHLIDDFEGPQAPAPWVFSNGPEFPGATGSLTTAAGHAGTGAHLAYDFSGGGAYVAASRTLDTAVPAAAISLWVRNAPGIHVTLRVVDDTGQTLQLSVARPLHAWDAGAWYRLVVPVGASSSHWGGADDGVLHGAVHSMAILAADPIELGASGSVDFDDVGWLDDLSWTLDPATLPLATVPPGAGVLRERLGANIHFTSDEQALDALHDAGVRWVRMDLIWSWVEQQGAYDFSAFDALVAALEARDMAAHFILDYGHPDHESGPGWPPQTPDEVLAFGDYAQAAAAHFAGHDVQFEVWNEANLDSFWPPAADVTQYAALASEAVHRVHLGNAAALVSTTGTSGVDIHFLRGCLALGCADEADAIGVHPYRMGGPESAAEEILLLRGVIEAALPSNPPVWDTEWGYSSSWYGSGHDTGPRERQAVLASREVLTSWSLGFPIAVYYDVRDDGVDPANNEHNFGLLANDYSDKPAMVALRTLSSIAETRVLTAFGLAEPTTLHVLELQGPTDRVYAIWTSAEGAESSIAVPADAQAVDMLGAAIPLSPNGDTAALAIREDSGPVYVTVPNPAAPDAGPTDADVDAPPDGAGGQAPAHPGDESSPASVGGCGCHTPGTGGPEQRSWAFALAAAGFAIRRRRRR